jgi:CRISPR type III-B/RAMP module-associated protein Cmr3
MTCKYLVNFTPLQPWFFGGEKTFDFGSVNEKNGKDSELGNRRYYVESLNTPQMTTIIGAIKYMILYASGFKFKNNWAYSDLEKEQLHKIAGQGSNPVDGDDLNKYLGLIKWVSPLMLKDGKSFWLPAPVDHQGGGGKAYNPYKIEKCPGAISNFGTNVYAFKKYEAKNGLFEGWLNVSTEICLANSGKDNEGIFEAEVRTGIAIDVDGSFYRQEFKQFKNKAMSFCVSVEIDFDDQDLNGHASTVMLGGKGSLFNAKFMKVCEGDHDSFELILESYKRIVIRSEEGNELIKSVAISDVFPLFLPFSSECPLVAYNLKNFRTINFNAKEMGKKESSMIKSFVKQFRSNSYTLIEAGMVVYYSPDFRIGELIYKPDTLQIIGFNHIIK